MSNLRLLPIVAVTVLIVTACESVVFIFFVYLITINSELIIDSTSTTLDS